MNFGDGVTMSVVLSTARRVMQRIEARTAPEFAARLDFAAHVFAQPMADDQTEAGTACKRAIGDSEESPYGCGETAIRRGLATGRGFTHAPPAEGAR